MKPIMTSSSLGRWLIIQMKTIRLVNHPNEWAALGKMARKKRLHWLRRHITRRAPKKSSFTRKFIEKLKSYRRIYNFWKLKSKRKLSVFTVWEEGGGEWNNFFLISQVKQQFYPHKEWIWLILIVYVGHLDF